MVWDGIQTLGFQDTLERLAVWSPKMPLSQHFRVCEAECVLTDISVHLTLCAPHPTNHKKVPKTTTEPSVFAMVWEAIETLGFRHILERLAALNLRVPLSQPFRVWKTECV